MTSHELSESLVKEVVEAIDAEEVADLALSLAQIESPAGRETDSGAAVAAWLQESGFDTRTIGLTEDRFSVVGNWPGQGGGPSLIFNAHLDIAVSRDDFLHYRRPDDPDLISARRDGDLLIGNGLVNDKGPMACFLVATKVLKELGVPHKGDIVLTAVPGEIGLEPVDEFQGNRYLGKDLGASYMITHGVIGDYALVAEASDFTMGWVEAGKLFVKVEVQGELPIYTPYIKDETDPAKHPNAIARAAGLIPRLLEWAEEYNQSHTYECAGGTVVPRVNIGAIRSGFPYKFTKTSEVCWMYLDIRIVPGQSPTEIMDEVRGVLDGSGIPATAECILFRPGYEAQKIEKLRDAVTSAHEFLFHSPPKPPRTEITSMWRDVNPFNAVGIPALTYGPGAGAGGGNHSLPVEGARQAACVYAISALLVTNGLTEIPV